ncbi:unnamed protein product [Meloidogyne enterolobii]|uniref:Uncharacterized protein n=2 Tax=Meloidogyne enterolobii TaxID=390850 RepID=A0ACB1AUJ0_MELEN|nr:unnamed protein product [Meloidogyne enterolobii]
MVYILNHCRTMLLFRFSPVLLLFSFNPLLFHFFSFQSFSTKRPTIIKVLHCIQNGHAKTLILFAREKFISKLYFFNKKN